MDASSACFLSSRQRMLSVNVEKGGFEEGGKWRWGRYFGGS